MSTLGEEFDEIFEDLQGTKYDDATNDLLRKQLREAIVTMASGYRDNPDKMLDGFAELALIAFHIGREHQARGYAAPSGRDPGTIGKDDVDVPDTIEALLNPELKWFRVQFDGRVQARNADEAYHKVDDGDWTITQDEE